MLIAGISLKYDFYIFLIYIYSIPADSEIRAHIELLDFVEEGQAQALLNIPPAERSKAHKFSDVLKIAAKEHKEGNDYVKKGEYKLAVRR